MVEMAQPVTVAVADPVATTALEPEELVVRVVCRTAAVEPSPTTTTAELRP